MSSALPPWPAGADKHHVRACNCEWCDALEAIYLEGERGVVPDARPELQAGLEEFDALA